MIRFVLFLMGLASTFPSFASAKFTVSRRQITTSFSVNFGSPGPVYASNNKYACPPYALSVRGQYPPFELTSIAYPYSQNVSEQHDLINNENITSTSGVLTWRPTRPAGTHFGFRVRDAAGNVAYSEEKWVAEAREGPCERRHKTLWDRMDDSDRFACISFSILGFLLLSWCICGPKKRRDGQAAQQGQPVAAGNDVPVAQQPQARAEEVELVVIPNQPAPAAAPPPPADYPEAADITPPPPAYSGWGGAAREK